MTERTSREQTSPAETGRGVDSRARSVAMFNDLLRKSNVAVDPVVKVGHLEGAKWLFAGICESDDRAPFLTGRAQVSRCLADLEAEYRAGGLYERPGVAAHLARMSVIHQRKRASLGASRARHRRR